MKSSPNLMASNSMSRQPAGLALLLGGLLLAPLACAPEAPSKNPSNSNNSIIVVGDTPSSENPELVTVNSIVGATVIVELPFSAGTGYSWSMPAHSDGVELVGKPETTPEGGGLAGGPMLAKFTLKVTESGRQTARLELARPWETDTPAARTIDIAINAGTAP